MPFEIITQTEVQPFTSFFARFSDPNKTPPTTHNVHLTSIFFQVLRKYFFPTPQHQLLKKSNESVRKSSLSHWNKTDSTPIQYKKCVRWKNVNVFFLTWFLYESHFHLIVNTGRAWHTEKTEHENRSKVGFEMCVFFWCEAPTMK